MIVAMPGDQELGGVHLPSWVGAPMRRLLDRHFGEAWWRQASDVTTWEALDAVPDAELWDARCEQRAELVQFVQERSGIDRLAERQPRAGIEAAARAFDPDVLTIGFARRNATYKRLGLGQGSSRLRRTRTAHAVRQARGTPSVVDRRITYDREARQACR
jgi:glucan phosphorylase